MNWAKQAGFILLAYIVFTTMRGNLRRWLQIIGLKPDNEVSMSQINSYAQQHGIKTDLNTLSAWMQQFGMKVTK